MHRSKQYFLVVPRYRSCLVSLGYNDKKSKLFSQLFKEPRKVPISFIFANGNAIAFTYINTDLLLPRYCSYLGSLGNVTTGSTCCHICTRNQGKYCFTFVDIIACIATNLNNTFQQFLGTKAALFLWGKVTTSPACFHNGSRNKRKYCLNPFCRYHCYIPFLVSIYCACLLLIVDGSQNEPSIGNDTCKNQIKHHSKCLRTFALILISL